MLLTVETSRSSKTRGCAVTYRAAPKEMFGTCPDTCGMKPKNTGTVEIDRDYEKALGDAVPKAGGRGCIPTFPRTDGNIITAPVAPCLISAPTQSPTR